MRLKCSVVFSGRAIKFTPTNFVARAFWRFKPERLQKSQGSTAGAARRGAEHHAQTDYYLRLWIGRFFNEEHLAFLEADEEPDAETDTGFNQKSKA